MFIEGGESRHDTRPDALPRHGQYAEKPSLTSGFAVRPLGFEPEPAD